MLSSLANTVGIRSCCMLSSYCSIKFNLVRRIFPPSTRQSSNFALLHRYRMNVAYFRQLPNEGQCEITFHLASDRYRIDKVFNFCRNITENIDASLERMKANIEKEVKKKVNKKKKNKSAPPMPQADTTEHVQEGLPAVEVSFFDYLKKQDIKDMTISDLLIKLEDTDQIILKILDDEFRIDFNSPSVQIITLPQSILAGFYVYPSKLEMVFAEKELSEFEWFRGAMPKSNNARQIEWHSVGKGFSYLAKSEDIGCHLKVVCTPKNSQKTGAQSEIVSTTKVEAGPGQCPFEVRHLFTQNKLSNEFQFRVMTYNILADTYADSDYSRTELFGYCPNYALHIDYRKQLFIKEILGYNADIVCLQEVDRKIYDLDLLPILQLKDIDGHYKAKGKTTEGLATFFNMDRFEVLDRQGITIGENLETLEVFEGLWSRIKGNDKLAERIKARSTAIQVTLLRSRQNPLKHLLVANTHFYFHPDADHIRLLQGGFSMLYVRDLYERFERDLKLDRDHFAILFCGDFNSVPECGMYRLMTERFVGDDMADWQSHEEEAVRGVTLSQPFLFQSACGCPKFTNYTVGFQACIDFIYYQSDALRVNDVVPLPSEEELLAYEAIPSPVFPSDHIALVASLEWNQKASTTDCLRSPAINTSCLCLRRNWRTSFRSDHRLGDRSQDCQFLVENQR
ncbi:2',5'-phosphodiesterase 12 [Toxorhynchites rutilus septentrionalis]|uniref:2',5'-phosphodiesterase 12 n=1 Tax=Toxorhynchites rutilus septentrionalis TaxID=329112 RepID=UPI0024798D4D|nr:2',5'-phosphodiesterase 12 [Toxorhynchites rutilus septentrionalis]